MDLVHNLVHKAPLWTPSPGVDEDRVRNFVSHFASPRPTPTGPSHR